MTPIGQGVSDEPCLEGTPRRIAAETAEPERERKMLALADQLEGMKLKVRPDEDRGCDGGC